MRFSLTSMIRLLVVLALMSTAAAVGLSRLVGPMNPSRRTGGVVHVNIHNFLLENGSQGSVWVDPDAGRSTTLPVSQGEVLSFASCSPWRDGQGTAQVIGRWSSDPRYAGDETEFGLVRLSFPDGEVIDRISTDVVPVSAPSWFPGTRARVLFAAGDGRLYHYAFEPANPQEASFPGEGRGDRPAALTWRCNAPGSGGVSMSDPHWSRDPRLEGLVIVALRTLEPDRGVMQFSLNHLWWLKLSTDGREIVEAGRLVDATDPEGVVEERCPSTGVSPDGGLAVAYLRKVGAAPWEVRIAPLDLGDRHDPSPVVRHVGVKLAENCMPHPPAFSTDGRFVSLVKSESWGTVIRRIGTTREEGPARIDTAAVGRNLDGLALGPR